MALRSDSRWEENLRNQGIDVDCEEAPPPSPQEIEYAALATQLEIEVQGLCSFLLKLPEKAALLKKLAEEGAPSEEVLSAAMSLVQHINIAEAAKDFPAALEKIKGLSTQLAGATLLKGKR